MAAKQSIPAPLFRAATAADAGQLATFSCGDSEWAKETEKFIQTASLRCHLGDPPKGLHPHSLIVAETDDGEIIGVAALRRGPIQLLNGSQVTGLILVVLAVATSSQGMRIKDDGKLSHALAYELIRQAARGRRTKDMVYGVVDFRNKQSLALIAALGLTPLEFGAVGEYHDVHVTKLDALLDASAQLL